MITYTMLVGQTYWFEESKKGANVFAFAAYATLGPQERASIRALRNGVVLPPGFDAWFVRATARKPANRFPTATTMIAALSEALELPPPATILASAYAHGTDQAFTNSPLDTERASLLPRSTTASLLGSARTTRGPREPKQTMAAMSAIAVSATVLVGLLYSVFAPSSASNTSNADRSSSSATTSAKGLPEIVPILSATSPPMEPAPTQPEASISPSITATQSRPAPMPRNTSASTSTVKTKKGKWIRD